ncbi:MAG: hypothetical protein LIR50_00295 [Bacillota bacterium]|nr:hypothetical protein [Bacillota bacterium]
MVKKSIGLVLLLMMVLTGCADKFDISNKTSINVTAIEDSAGLDKSIPYKYAFTGFVFVDDVVNGLPAGTKVFNTQEEWNSFVSDSFPYSDIPLPVYSGGINFTKDSLIYYSIVDAKVDFYAKAWQIDKITVKNQKLNVIVKNLDGNLTITANNSEKKGGHRYVILAAVEKKYLQDIK